jgi:plasmid stabilization system protein ParE
MMIAAGTQSTKPRVLYVLGYGRSGSTVLGMALGQHSEMVNLGEISALRRFVPGPTYVPPRACGCLQQLDQCPYWSGVARRLGSMERLAQTNIALSPSMGWRRYAPWLPEPIDELLQWGKAAADLYRATLEEANAKVAIDTSKGTARAWWLLRSGAVDLRLIWLTRRPEDVLRSQIKHGHSTLRTVLSWQLAQRQAAQLARHVESSAVRVPRISYERLTEQPRTVLSEILEHTGLPWQEAVLTPRADHVIGGDHVVKHGGRHVIEPSTGVRPPLPLNARLLLRLLNTG